MKSEEAEHHGGVGGLLGGGRDGCGGLGEGAVHH